METMVRDKPKRRGAFVYHCSKSYFLGADFENYRSRKMWMKDTRATRISVTVFHKHKYITDPSITPEYLAMATSGKLMSKLKGRMATHLINGFTTVGATCDHYQAVMDISRESTMEPSNCTAKTDQQSLDRTTTTICI